MPLEEANHQLNDKPSSRAKKAKIIGGKNYYSVPEAAKQVDVSRMTMLRWVTGRVPLNGLRIQAIRDPISGHYYVCEDSIKELVKRFQPVSTAS